MALSETKHPGNPGTLSEAGLTPVQTPALERACLLAAALTAFMSPFMASAINVALPAIQRSFGMGAVALSWVSTAYLLASAIVLVPAGKIADIFGRKKIFTLGLTIFSASSLLLALAPTTALLILFRILQGSGAAMTYTTGMAILTSVFPPQKRGRAIGFYVSAVYIGLSIGPTLGGILTQHWGWRSIFAVITPLGLAPLFITLKYLKAEWRDAPEETLDVWGSLIYGAAILALVYGATQLPGAMGGYLLMGGLAGLAGFVYRQRRVQYPVFEVRLFQHNRLFAFSSLAALINYAATFAVTFLMSLYLQYIKGFTPQTAGIILLAQPAMQALFSPLAGRWSDRIEPRVLASAGMGLTALALVQLIFLGPQTPLVYLIGLLLMLGVGFGLFSSPNMNAIMGAVEKRYYGIASGAVATMRLIGQMSSMALATVIFAIFMGDTAITPEIYPLFLQSLKAIFVTASVLCTLGIFFSLVRGNIR